MAIGSRLKQGAKVRQRHMNVRTCISQRVKQQGADVGKASRLHAGRLLSVCCEESALAYLWRHQ